MRGGGESCWIRGGVFDEDEAQREAGAATSRAEVGLLPLRASRWARFLRIHFRRRIRLENETRPQQLELHRREGCLRAVYPLPLAIARCSSSPPRPTPTSPAVQNELTGLPVRVGRRVPSSARRLAAASFCVSKATRLRSSGRLGLHCGGSHGGRHRERGEGRAGRRREEELRQESAASERTVRGMGRAAGRDQGSHWANLAAGDVVCEGAALTMFASAAFSRPTPLPYAQILEYDPD